MNAYISDTIAREHADRLMADAREARRARRVRAARRAAVVGKRRGGTAVHTSAVARPFVALHHWLVAGEL